MQIVIDIPEDAFEAIKKNGWSYYDIRESVKNGTPLPEHHGRLIDADALIQELSVVSSRPVKSQLYILREAPTIIEADRGE